MGLHQVHETSVGLRDFQFQRLNELLLFASRFNKFYKEKLDGIPLPIKDFQDLKRLPFTTKKELAKDQMDFPPFGRNHTYPVENYIRYHQTSGTTGRPLKVLDTRKSWDWWIQCWVEVLKSAGVTRADRCYLAFSFGPFIGFWAAYEGIQRLGALAIPGGSMSSEERLNSMIQNSATVLLCTPSYALHLAEVAEKIGVDIQNSSIQKIITAGEPGGSIPSVRKQIENLFGAKLYDHVGMTEMGAYGYSCREQNGLHVNEKEFIVEIIDPETLEHVKPGEKGELVLTNLGRYGYPMIRYRTGDIVIYQENPCPCGNPYQFLPGGLVGRADDMVVIRGVNIYPTSIEAIIREFPEIKEFRIIYYTEHEMDQMKVQIEGPENVVESLARLLRVRLGLRIEVERVEDGSLTRFEMKARRIIDKRKNKSKVT
ncbi:phenylacetate--CoA ligase family protein [Ureibacillus terrenus]|uniref:Phenylacetate--CoA ligase n=1 Tax=Ureibacillus terrenus TaxID=118246 RepID=A0A540V353_9BACL|nr:AMP-binding protein [Ureibacillus terrenus]MED3764694.1 AMP-binding protein [Ureibacillus terrenus]TQE90653.1 phenylacetate--CoA ligase [Ureibacillus terrenus]